MYTSLTLDILSSVVLQQMAVGAANNAAGSAANGSSALSAAVLGPPAPVPTSGGDGGAAGPVSAGVATASVVAAAVAAGVVVSGRSVGGVRICPNETKPEILRGLATVDFMGNVSFLRPDQAMLLGTTFEEVYNDVFGCASDFSRVAMNCEVSCYDVAVFAEHKNGTNSVEQQCCNRTTSLEFGEILRCPISCNVHCQGCNYHEPLFWVNSTADSFNESLVVSTLATANDPFLLGRASFVPDGQGGTTCSSICKVAKAIGSRVCKDVSSETQDCITELLAYDTVSGEAVGSYVVSTPPTTNPSESPKQYPSRTPTEFPSKRPSPSPSELPSQSPSGVPTTTSPTGAPTSLPSKPPTPLPTQTPTEMPTQPPSESPTQTPTESPTWSPSKRPTMQPSSAPSDAPTSTPTQSPTLPPISFNLVNTISDTTIRALFSGSVINLAKDGASLSIEAVPRDGVVGSLLFTLDGLAFKTENNAPYFLGGDDMGTNYFSVPLLSSLGRHQLVATTYSEESGGGTLGTSVGLTFEVILG
jgi:hypothetical protein